MVQNQFTELHMKSVVGEVTISKRNRCSERSEDTFCGAESRLAKQGLHIFEEDMVQWSML